MFGASYWINMYLDWTVDKLGVAAPDQNLDKPLWNNVFAKSQKVFEGF